MLQESNGIDSQSRRFKLEARKRFPVAHYTSVLKILTGRIPNDCHLERLAIEIVPDKGEQGNFTPWQQSFDATQSKAPEMSLASTYVPVAV